MQWARVPLVPLLPLLLLLLLLQLLLLADVALELGLACALSSSRASRPRTRSWKVL